MQSFTLTLGMFNHTKQSALSVDVESYDFAEWLESQADELTLECLEIDSQAFPTIKRFDDLSTLIDWLDNQSFVDLDQVSDFLDLFNLSDLDKYDDICTGCDDFSEYAQSLADECLLHSVPDSVKRYFDYDAFKRDLSFDYATGRYVWRNC
jgi:hypothetical protein